MREGRSPYLEMKMNRHNPKIDGPLPNQISVYGGIAHVTRDRTPIASYPHWLNGRIIPTFAEVRADAKWHDANGNRI